MRTATEKFERNLKPFYVIFIAIISSIGITAILFATLSAHRSWIKSDIQEIASSVSALKGTLISTHERDVIRLKIRILKRGISSELATNIADIVYEESRDHRVDPDLVLAIIRKESNFEPAVISSARAVGLMQVRQHWADINGGEDLKDIRTNISRGIKILKLYLIMYKKLDVSLTAYNRGQNPVDAALINGENPINNYAKGVLDVYRTLGKL